MPKQAWWWVLALVAVLPVRAPTPPDAPTPPAAPTAPTARGPWVDGLSAHASSSLSVSRSGEWVEWWRADAAPERWPAPLPAVSEAVVWRAAGPGLSRGEIAIAGSGWRVRVVLAAIDPSAHRLRLELPGGRRGWTVDRASEEAVVAVNAGQFVGSAPWGWVVSGGKERRPVGRGPLVATIAADPEGVVHWIPDSALPGSLASLRPAEAFQSYPVVLQRDGEVPWHVRAAGRGVDVDHRDSRLALGVLRDGRFLVALTRFDSFGGRFPLTPFGPTVAEMAALLGALGCRTAVLLDGGLSGQLLVRDSTGETHRWPGLRKVPMGLVFEPLHGWRHQ